MRSKWRRGRRRSSNSRRRENNKGSVLDTPNKPTKAQNSILIEKKQSCARIQSDPAHSTSNAQMLGLFALSMGTIALHSAA